MAEIDEDVMLKAIKAQGRYADNGQLMDIYRAIMEAVEAERTRDKWQPIETAPKDGTEINAYRPDQGVFTCRWSTMEELVAHDEYGDPVEDYNEDQADWWHDRWGWLERELRPTHWMPLPPPPAIKGASHDQA